MKIGYARVSTQDQKLDLQLKSLKTAGCQKIFREKVSGFCRQRPEFQRMLDQIRPGDIIIVWKLDRLARSTQDLLNTMDTINEAGGKFQSVSEPWANTTTHAGKMIMTVFAGIAEFERALIRERTGAGRQAAKQRGVRFGRPSKLNTNFVTFWKLSYGPRLRFVIRVRVPHRGGNCGVPEQLFHGQQIYPGAGQTCRVQITS